MSDTEHSLSEEDISFKFQELKDKVIQLKESNKAIQSCLDALCGVGDGEKTFCPFCQRQDEEAVILKKLQARVKDLEFQERYRDEEIDKLRKSLDMLIKKFDKLFEVTQALPFGAKSETNITRTGKAVYGFNRKRVCDPNESQTDQNVSHSGSETVVSTKTDLFGSSTQEKKLGRLSESGNQSCSQGTHGEYKFSIAEGPSLLVCDQLQNEDERDQESLHLKERNVSHTKMGSLAEYLDPKSTMDEEVIDSAIDNFERHNEAIKLQDELNIQTGLSSVVPKREDSEKRIDFVNRFDSLPSVESSGESINEWSEETSDFLNHFDSLKNAECSLDVRHDSQPLESTGEKLKSPGLGTVEQIKIPIDVSQSPNLVSTSVSEVNPNRDPGAIKGDNIMLRLQHSYTTKDSGTVITDLSKSTVHKTEDLHSDSVEEKLLTENTSERNPIVAMKFVGGVANFTKSSIKRQDFPKKQETSGNAHNQHYEPFSNKSDDDQKDGNVVNKQGPYEGTVDLDMHLPVFRVVKSHWSELAQKELDEALWRNIRGIHTVLCIDTSASMRQGPTWEQTQHFTSQFIKGLEAVKGEFDINEEYVALSIFGQEVRVVHRLTNSYTLLQQSFSALKLGGPSPMYGGLLMALAGVASVSTPSAVGIRIQPRIILITDGHPTNPLLSSGPDVFNPDKKEKIQSVVMEAVLNIALRKIRIHCVPVGDADMSFLEWIAASACGKVYSYKDGRKLARKTINTVYAGHLIKHWKMMNGVGKEISLENVMHSISVGLGLPILTVKQMAFLSRDEKVEVLEIAKEALEEGLVDEMETALNKFYESDNPNIKLPPLGTRVRRGPDWDNGLQDGNGPGTVIGHHKKKRKVHVEWDKNGESDFYRYGHIEKYEVIIVDEPRIRKSDELIATGFYVKRGNDWKYGSQDGTPGAVGVVVKVMDNGKVVVRWPDKSKNFYRFGADGCFDLEICSAFESQTGLLAQTLHQSTPYSAENPNLNPSSAKSTRKNKNAVSKNTPKKDKNS